MGNRNYKRGRAFEYYIVDVLRGLGCYAVRSAGSHSLFDVIGVYGGQVFLIQCKTGRMLARDFREFCQKGEKFCRGNVHVFFCHRDKRVFMVYYLNKVSWLDKKEFIGQIKAIIKEEGDA